MAKNIVTIAKEIADLPIAQMGFELADVDYVREDGQMCLNFYIWRASGVCVEDCELVSKAIDPLLDEADPSHGTAYCLCISTWGDRPLKTQRDMERYMDKEVELKLKKPMAGKKKSYRGLLKAFDEQKITIEYQGQLLDVDKELISIVHPYIGFN